MTRHYTDVLIGVVIAVVLITALAPTIFDNLATLNGTTGVPTWLGTVIFVIAGVGILYLLLDAFLGKK